MYISNPWLEMQAMLHEQFDLLVKKKLWSRKEPNNET